MSARPCGAFDPNENTRWIEYVNAKLMRKETPAASQVGQPKTTCSRASSPKSTRKRRPAGDEVAHRRVVEEQRMRKDGVARSVGRLIRRRPVAAEDLVDDAVRGENRRAFGRGIRPAVDQLDESGELRRQRLLRARELRDLDDRLLPVAASLVHRVLRRRGGRRSRRGGAGRPRSGGRPRRSTAGGSCAVRPGWPRRGRSRHRGSRGGLRDVLRVGQRIGVEVAQSCVDAASAQRR